MKNITYSSVDDAMLYSIIRGMDFFCANIFFLLLHFTVSHFAKKNIAPNKAQIMYNLHISTLQTKIIFHKFTFSCHLLVHDEVLGL